MRIDKFLWAVRLFKTRSLASKACTSDRVLVNNENAKAGKVISTGVVISVKVNPIWKSYKVIDIPKSRVGAKLVLQYIEETTSETDLEILRNSELMNRQNRLYKQKGRPTKKNRRDIDRLRSD